MKKLFGFIIMMFSLIARSQTVETSITVPYNSGGATRPALLYLPDDYSTTSKNYPLLVFLHGAGESKPPLSTIYNSSTAGGPSYFIERGQWPSSFINPKDGQSYKFIVLSPQAVNTGWSTSGPELDYALKYMAANYRIDVSRIYLTGLSAGGAGTVQYTAKIDGNSNPFNPTYKAAAFVPMSEANGADPSWGVTIASSNTLAWGFGDPINDIHGEYTQKLMNYINNAKSGLARFTSYSGGHCCWNNYYNPTYKETINGTSMNIYQWMLQYTQGSGTSSNQSPVANAGSDQTITLPTNSVQLSGNGSDPDGSIVSYTWTKVAGPSQYSINNSSIANPVVSNLVAGTYTFQLTVKDNAGATNSDNVNITVNSSSSSGSTGIVNAIPGKIEAENFSNMSGVQTETTSDAGGGKDVGYVDDNDWMDYNVTVSSAGTYTVSFRVASVVSTGQLQLKSSSGSVLATANIPNTGAWQSWTTITTSVNLSSGSQTLRVFSVKGGWNINWLDFSNGSSSSTGSSTKYVKVNVYDGTTPYSASDWNNWNALTSSNTNITSETFKYSDGTASGVTANLSYSDNVVDNGTMQDGMAPGKVLQTTSYATGSRTLTISGLSASKTYNIEFYASRVINPNNRTQYSANGVSAIVSTYNNISNKATLAGLVPNAQGQIVITITALDTYSYINGFTIIENPASSSTVTAKSSVTEVTTNEVSPQVQIKEGKESVPQLTFAVSPDNFKDKFVVNINNSIKGKLHIQLLDNNGSVVKEIALTKKLQRMQVYVSAKGVTAGEYNLVLSIDDWKETRKVSKQ